MYASLEVLSVQWIRPLMSQHKCKVLQVQLSTHIRQIMGNVFIFQPYFV
jgi:hypothetical protein